MKKIIIDKEDLEFYYYQYYEQVKDLKNKEYDENMIYDLKYNKYYYYTSYFIFNSIKLFFQYFHREIIRKKHLYYFNKKLYEFLIDENNIKEIKLNYNLSNIIHLDYLKFLVEKSRNFYKDGNNVELLDNTEFELLSVHIPFYNNNKNLIKKSIENLKMLSYYFYYLIENCELEYKINFFYFMYYIDYQRNLIDINYKNYLQYSIINYLMNFLKEDLYQDEENKNKIEMELYLS